MPTPLPLQASSGVTLKLSTDKVIGNGSFGVVFEAEFLETKETVAVKKVLQDKRFKNRELQVRARAAAPEGGGPAWRRRHRPWRCGPAGSSGAVELVSQAAATPWLPCCLGLTDCCCRS